MYRQPWKPLNKLTRYIIQWKLRKRSNTIGAMICSREIIGSLFYCLNAINLKVLLHCGIVGPSYPLVRYSAGVNTWAEPMGRCSEWLWWLRNGWFQKTIAAEVNQWKCFITAVHTEHFLFAHELFLPLSFAIPNWFSSFVFCYSWLIW